MKICNEEKARDEAVKWHFEGKGLLKNMLGGCG
jgi:hypothetical protein